MIGRLIIALLIVGSAAFVMLQKRETESTDIQANLSDTRARQAEQRTAELDRQVATLREEVSTLEHNLEWQYEQLTELAHDCTPAAPEAPQVYVAKLLRRPVRAGHPWPPAQRLALLLGGDQGAITRVRLFSSLDDGTPMNDFVACDTFGNDAAMLLGVIVGGKDVIEEFGPQRIEKKRGVMPLELVCDSALDPDEPLTVEVLLAGGVTARATTARKATPDQRSPR